MNPPLQPTPPLGLRLYAWIPFVASAALVSFAVHLAVRDPIVGAGLGAMAVVLLLPQYLARRRLRRLLVGGNVDAILSAWKASLDRVPHPETMAPLLRATALATHGMVDEARTALGKAVRGPAWQAAVEQRLFIEILLGTFEGEREHALERAQILVALPVPPAGPFTRARITTLRAAMLAFARAFAHAAAPGDLGRLLHASRSNPLVFWPMRYAAAIIYIDQGKPQRARELLQRTPSWSANSVFRAYDAELESLLGGSPTP